MEPTQPTSLETHEEIGLKRDALSDLISSRNKASGGWALEPKPRMPDVPRSIFA
jgi:hypothetical protein